MVSQPGNGAGSTLKGATAFLIAVTLGACGHAAKITKSDADTVLAHLTIEVGHPAEPGADPVARLYYGSGKDQRRPEYRDSVVLKTKAVDASKLVRLGGSEKSRNKYWGFTPKEFPVNGRVWYPSTGEAGTVLDPPAVGHGEGRLPLVLIVHGNHDMKDYSDPGYGYLGELMASRGFITVSVDENFLNGGISEENDGRGFMLLEHLKAWRGFDTDSSSVFFGRVDLDRVALIGHSRGGEAVAVAAAFNTLSHYPDDATVAFDYGFGIRSIIAIAPVDGQYLPTGRSTPLRDVNYLVFHGSHDGDVTSFHGLRQYQRVEFSGDEPRFKAAIYMYRANHGQWNTVWNNKDNGPRSGRMLDLGVLVDPEAQRTFGKLYISSFLEATLHDDERYLPVFVDHRVVGRWLPPTLYVSRFQASGFRPLATFEEDIDVTTGTAPAVAIRADSMAAWGEKRLDLRSRNRSTTSGSQVNQVVELGWNNGFAGSDSVGVPAVFRVSLPEGLAAGWQVDADWTLDFVVAATEATPGPRKLRADSTATDSTAANGSRSEKNPVDPKTGNETDKDDDAADDPVDFSVEVADDAGHVARVRAGRYAPIRKPLKISVMRRKDTEPSRFGADHEFVLQSITIPLRDLREVEPALLPDRIREIRFVFDRTKAGTVLLDDVGLSRLGHAFLSARVPDDTPDSLPD